MHKSRSLVRPSGCTPIRTIIPSSLKSGPDYGAAKIKFLHEHGYPHTVAGTHSLIDRRFNGVRQ
jgi:hypothetical protein